MTVSPRWPQDGTPTPQGVGDGGAAPDSEGTSSPPTLLRLPNLNASPPVTTAQNSVVQNSAAKNSMGATTAGQIATPQHPVGHAAGTAAQTADPQSVVPVSPVASQPSAVPAAGLDALGGNVDQPIDQQTEPPQQANQPFSGRTFPDPSNPVSDAPAGRSWMEVTQQHGVVVLLLLVVVATAIFTGRDTSVNDPNPAIADAVDLFGVEDGIAVDMPMSGHTHDLETGVASSPQAALVPNSNDIVSLERSIDEITATENSATSVASLAPPRMTTERNSVASNGSARSSVVENKFAQQLDATTVSNRFGTSAQENSDIAFNPPSLEDLANSLPDGDSTAAPHADVIQSPGNQFDSPAPVPSKTPFGISDWTQYLPELPSANSK